MKAMMSDRNLRPVHCWIGADGGHSARCWESDEQHALDELARILGETERGAHAVIIHHADSETELDRRAEWAPVMAILAESLAAFVN